MKVKIPTIKDNDGQRSMKYCLYHPEKEARQFTGHLILGGKVVFIGYCGNNCSDNQDGIPQGCRGNFRRSK